LRKTGYAPLHKSERSESHSALHLCITFDRAKIQQSNGLHARFFRSGWVAGRVDHCLLTAKDVALAELEGMAHGGAE
jgi:hypothetical protein